MKYYIIISALIMMTACGHKKGNTKSVTAQTKTSTFSADSAFLYTKAQTDFGPRVPNTLAQEECAKYYVSKFESWGAKVEIQTFATKGYEGTIWNGKNIIASYNTNNPSRILLCAHWDSRFIAEEDKDKDKQKLAIDGANDGASGVAVLMEIARQIHIKAATVGIDIVLFDVEDQGAPSYAANASNANSWCLGSQHWAKEAKKEAYTAKFGILLDMVGAGDAVFMKEQISAYYAPDIVEYVWQTAADLGYADYFINQKGGTMTDDHLYVNRIAEIPCIDIIDFDINRGGFNKTWHTHDDNINNINKSTLGAVGNVLMKVIYEQ